jgi:hypothetical protein
MVTKSSPNVPEPDLYTFAAPTEFHGFFRGWSRIKPKSLTWFFNH